MIVRRPCEMAIALALVFGFGVCGAWPSCGSGGSSKRTKKHLHEQELTPMPTTNMSNVYSSQEVESFVPNEWLVLLYDRGVVSFLP